LEIISKLKKRTLCLCFILQSFSIKLISKALKPTFILALDIGTSSVRAALYDMYGEVLPETMVKNERTVKITDDGGAVNSAQDALNQVIK
jgi:hypothetical protein